MLQVGVIFCLGQKSNDNKDIIKWASYILRDLSCNPCASDPNLAHIRYFLQIA